jgi:hypothetical protein
MLGLEKSSSTYLRGRKLRESKSRGGGYTMITEQQRGSRAGPDLTSAQLLVMPSVAVRRHTALAVSHIQREARESVWRMILSIIVSLNPALIRLCINRSPNQNAGMGIHGPLPLVFLPTHENLASKRRMSTFCRNDILLEKASKQFD